MVRIGIDNKNSWDISCITTFPHNDDRFNTNYFFWLIKGGHGS